MKNERPKTSDAQLELIRLHKEEVLSHEYAKLFKVTYDLRRRDGSWQTQTREIYDRGDGCAVLLYNRAKKTMILVRQFRYPVYVNGHPDRLIEVPAGILEQADPESRIRSEIEEETGFRALNLKKVYECYMSPGTVTEKLHLYVGEYDDSNKSGDGGGLPDEGEDIEVLEWTLEDAVSKIREGTIADAKTILLIQWAQLNLDF